eukprot:CAMPEP_0172521874 /NCGR_PEP_ID=MMETSP1066-20121228/292823_1 /TAXON_ID=671091 /ORGANISM="Coscinodiscus wailesii, Strain CCMP2513" /LENGTH=229 /DNA_ID=CAMNT_0013304837 /DNA_START=573 /DNA_END=1262 /DNA_ORIENTATION=+
MSADTTTANNTNISNNGTTNGTNNNDATDDDYAVTSRTYDRETDSKTSLCSPINTTNQDNNDKHANVLVVEQNSIKLSSMDDNYVQDKDDVITRNPNTTNTNKLSSVNSTNEDKHTNAVGVKQNTILSLDTVDTDEQNDDDPIISASNQMTNENHSGMTSADMTTANNTNISNYRTTSGTNNNDATDDDYANISRINNRETNSMTSLCSPINTTDEDVNDKHANVLVVE